MIKNSNIQDLILNAINSSKKIVLPANSAVSPKLRALSTLWNFALDESFPDVERVEIAADLLGALPS